MKPFVKWAGGKTQLLSDIRLSIPDSFNTYYEPFLGGGAVFLDIKPERAIVSDSNPQLINTYTAIRDNVFELMDRIDSIDERQGCNDILYYEIRDRFNEKVRNNINDIETAALLIWLNHHCFNGLYRTNREGCFNTPWNKTKTYRMPYDRNNLIEIAEYLNANDITIICDDYKNVLTQPVRGDFVFLDPPYDPVGKYGDFKRYTKNQFYKNDQEDLSEIIAGLTNRNVGFCLTNSNTELIRQLYQGFNISIIQTHRNINSKGKDRYGEDAIITA